MGSTHLRQRDHSRRDDDRRTNCDDAVERDERTIRLTDAPQTLAKQRELLQKGGLAGHLSNMPLGLSTGTEGIGPRLRTRADRSDWRAWNAPRIDRTGVTVAVISNLKVEKAGHCQNAALKATVLPWR